MIDPNQGKSRIAIEVQHFDGNATFCAILIDHPDHIYQYITNIQDFLPVILSSNEVIFIAKSDIKAFRVCPVQSSDDLWSLDPYRILGVSHDISIEDLHARYVDLLKHVHPEVIEDKQIHVIFNDIASDITRRIIQAYEYIKSQKMSQLHG